MNLLSVTLEGFLKCFHELKLYFEALMASKLGSVNASSIFWIFLSIKNNLIDRKKLAGALPRFGATEIT